MIVFDPDSIASADTSNSTMAQPILKQYADVFSDTPSGISPNRELDHTTNTGTPPVAPAFRMSPKVKAYAEQMVSQSIQKGWFCPSHSLYSSPILFVRRKDGLLRMCTEY